MPVLNQLDYTMECVDSIRRNTPRGLYEFIAVDNGSTDGSGKYLRSKKIKVITNRKNIGVAGAWNQGVRASRGKYCCIINNDIITTPGWLENLVRYHEAMPDAGIVCPATREGGAGYGLDKYAAQYVRGMKRVSAKGLYGWCMLIRKERFKQAGYFDRHFGIGIGEDTDFMMRLRKLGHESYITGSAFIHHYGSRTISGIRKEKGNAFELNNIAVLRERWGHGTEAYLQRKLASVVKAANNLYLKLTRGHTLLERAR